MTLVDRLPSVEGVLAKTLPKWSVQARQILHFCLVLIVINMAYWFWFVPSAFPPASLAKFKSIPFSKVELAKLPTPTLEAAANATYKPITLPHTECCDPVYLALRLTFDAPNVDADGLGLLNFHQVDNFIVALNGSIIQRQGVMTFGQQSFHGQKRSSSRLPTGLLKRTGNELTYITVRHGFPYTDLEPVKIAPFVAYEKWWARRMWTLDKLPYVTTTLTFLVGAFAFIILWRSKSRTFAFWLMALAWFMCANQLYTIFLDPPFGGIGRMIAFFAINSAIPVCFLCFIDAWSNKAIPWLQAVAVSIWVLFVAFCVWALNTLPMSQGFDLPGEVWTWHSLIFGGLIVARIVWHFVSTRETRIIEAAILSIVAIAITLDGLTALLNLREYNLHLNESSPLLLVGMVAAFLQRNFQLFQSADALNAALSTQLKAREADLEASAAALRAQVAETAIQTERARIMRDMHDGMGGQLLSLLMQTRDPDTPRAELEETVEIAIADLRLLIDSLDSVGDDLEIALAMFKERLAPRLSGAKVTLDWPNTPLGLKRVFSPAEILSIYRILQEAISNALRHGAPTKIIVAQAMQGDQLAITLLDNGKGMDPNASAGRGLTNMRRRIQELGGSMNIEAASSGGTRLVFLVPELS